MLSLTRQILTFQFSSEIVEPYVVFIFEKFK